MKTLEYFLVLLSNATNLVIQSCKCITRGIYEQVKIIVFSINFENTVEVFNIISLS